MVESSTPTGKAPVKDEPVAVTLDDGGVEAEPVAVDLDGGGVEDEPVAVDLDGGGVEDEPVAETLAESLSVFDDWVDRLVKLAALYKEELLTDREFTAGKQRVFSDAQIAVFPLAEFEVLPPVEVEVLPPVEVAETPPPYTDPVEPAGGGFTTDQGSGDYTFGFQFVEAGLAKLDIDGFDFTGFGLSVSTELQNGFYAGFSFLGAEDDDLGGIAALNSFGLFFGMHHPINEQIEVYGSLGFAYAELEVASLTYDEDSFPLQGGVLYSPIDKMLLSVGLTHADSDSSLGFGAQWFVEDQISLGVSVIEDQTLFGVRWSH